MTISVVETPAVEVSVTETPPVELNILEAPVVEVDVETNYNPTTAGMWIETGLGANGQGWTIWFEDGA